MNEYPSRGEDIHNPGENFIDPVYASKESSRRYVWLLHTLAKVEAGETPAGNECENYTAICGRLAFDYTYSSECMRFGKLEEIMQSADYACPTCFSEERIADLKPEIADRIRQIQLSQASNKDLPDFLRNPEASR